MLSTLFSWLAYAYTYGIYLFLAFIFVFGIVFHVYESITEKRH